MLSFIAIVPTACGIETEEDEPDFDANPNAIAIVPTACGIETWFVNLTSVPSSIAIVPTACGIETIVDYLNCKEEYRIAIVPTACGIETMQMTNPQLLFLHSHCNSTYRLRY